MSYVKQTWVDRLVQFAKRYSVAEDASGNLTLTVEPGTVTAAGTALDASRLNHMETGIEDASNRLNDLEGGTFAAGDAAALGGVAAANWMRKDGGASFPFTAMPYIGASPLYEYGSNANGEYWKFQDGLLICRMNNFIASGALTINTASGNLFVSSTRTWTYPHAFVNSSDRPNVDWSARYVSGTIYPIWGVNVNLRYNNGEMRALCTSSVTSVTYAISARAAGRWK